MPAAVRSARRCRAGSPRLEIPSLRQIARPGRARAGRPTASGDEASQKSETPSPQPPHGPQSGSRRSRNSRSAAASFADLNLQFLYDKSRRLLAIGYNVDDRRLDASFYDLLASEARLASFVGIAQGGLPQEHWFALGRLLTTTRAGPVLISWSGSMFEYLMPLLVMPTYEDTLLDQTCRAAVARQIEYGGQRGVPWGISESGYNTIDVQLNYQYRAFGVPGLGLKRGLAEDLVIAPYATVMALMVAPANGVRQPAADGRGRVPGTLRILRGHRLHALAAAARAVERGRSLVHGPSPGDEFPVAGVSLCSTGRCSGGSRRTRRSRRRTCLLQERIPNANPIYSACRSRSR